MKKNNVIKFIILIFLLTQSCETERIIFKGPYFVRFTNLSDGKLESYSKPITIEVHNAGPALTEDVTITYSISGSARENVDYKIVGKRGIVTIKKGEYFGYIQLQLINNANNILRAQDVVFTLQNVSTNKLQVGEGESNMGKTFTFTITDDCILGGTYIGEKDLLTIPIEGISITSTDCENYTLSNWDIYTFDNPRYSYEFLRVRQLTFVDNGDNTLTIPKQKESTLPDSLATIQGSGTVDPTTRKITMTVILIDSKAKPQPQNLFTLIPD